MGDVILLIGPPGTGKTEFDLRTLEGWLQGGASREEVAYVAFMRAAAADGARRMGIGPEEAKGLWFRTLHSACYRILGLHRGEVLTPSWLREFGQKIGISMEGEDDGDVEEVADAILLIREMRMKVRSQGVLYRRMFNLSRLLCRTEEELDATRKSPHPRAMPYLWPDFRGSIYADFVERYEGEKASAGKLDFVDMLERVLREDHDLPMWRYAVVDEFQDMTPLQMVVVEKLFFGRCETVILSGDDHQAIMTFQGSSAEDFLSYRNRAKLIQLAQTHRFGDGIVAFSNRIAERIRDRQPRDVVGLPGKKSRVQEVYQFLPGDILDGDLIMHRHVSGCREIASRLVAGGIPFWNERGPNPLSRTSEIRAYQAWKSLGEGRPLTADDLQYLTHHVPSRKDGVQVVVHGAKKKIKEMPPTMPISHPESYLSAVFLRFAREGDFRFLDCPFAEYYSRVEKDGHDLLRKPTTVVTTIHGAKGRQASRTWLFSETYPKALAGGDGEHRVAYVGATRAQDDVLLVRENIVGDWTLNYDYPCAGEEVAV